MRLSWVCIVTKIWKDPNPSKTHSKQPKSAKDIKRNNLHTNITINYENVLLPCVTMVF